MGINHKRTSNPQFASVLGNRSNTKWLLPVSDEVNYKRINLHKVIPQSDEEKPQEYWDI